VPTGIDDWSKMKYGHFIAAIGGWNVLQKILAAAAQIARKHNVSIANVATRWVLQQEAVAAAIVGARLGESEHRSDNAMVFTFALDASDMAQLDEPLRTHQRFQAALWQLFAAPSLSVPSTADLELCRCEGVALSEVETPLGGGSDCIGSIKRQSRLGMGRCQGRYCVPEAVAHLPRFQAAKFDESFFAAPRPPVKPVPISDLRL
jgi:hypothetical protein